MGHDKGSGKFYLKQQMKESNWLSEMLIFFLSLSLKIGTFLS